MFFTAEKLLNFFIAELLLAKVISLSSIDKKYERNKEFFVSMAYNYKEAYYILQIISLYLNL